MTTTTYYSTIDSPLGQIFLQGDGQFLTGLFMPQHKGWRGPDASWQLSDAPFATVRQQLAEYFAGERKQFDVPVKLAGTPFQQRVWQELVLSSPSASASRPQPARWATRTAAIRFRSLCRAIA
jgi:methylated-DNA-[protein]-cysteine S-methyltransferase